MGCLRCDCMMACACKCHSDYFVEEVFAIAWMLLQWCERFVLFAYSWFCCVGCGTFARWMKLKLQVKFSDLQLQTAHVGPVSIAFGNRSTQPVSFYLNLKFSIPASSWNDQDTKRLSCTYDGNKSTAIWYKSHQKKAFSSFLGYKGRITTPRSMYFQRYYTRVHLGRVV